MDAGLASIFTRLGARDILDRLADLRRDATYEEAELPEGAMLALLAALSVKLPELAPDIDEMPAGRGTRDSVAAILSAGEAALDARADYLSAAA